MKPVVVSSALLALCLPMLSVAAPAEDRQAPVASVEQILQRMDRDNDGKLSFEEYRNAMTRRFHRLDADGDGFLVQKEIPKEWLAVGAADLADGKVSAEEFASGLRPAFDGFDLDKDNSLNDEELAAFARARAAKLEATP
ncbi:MAG TPA: EF-hand domain-containing protein [Pseudoxanthomonas sp.]